MRFDLDKPLTDEILFCMENQDKEFLLDTEKRKIIDVRKETTENPENDDSSNRNLTSNRYVSLPEWDSNDGYRLMEKFVQEFKNPIIREELSGALSRNKGVFRAYRNTLSQYPEAEKKWNHFKESEMKKEIISWYNALREEWGLEPVGCEPEDNLSLVLEDFFIKSGKGDFSFTAETVNGETAGSVNANLEMVNKKQTLHIDSLEVIPAYRGMGLGKTLLSKMLEKADKEKLDVSIDLPSDMEFFSRSLYLENFKPIIQKFYRINEK